MNEKAIIAIIENSSDKAEAIEKIRAMVKNRSSPETAANLYEKLDANDKELFASFIHIAFRIFNHLPHK